MLLRTQQTEMYHLQVYGLILFALFSIFYSAWTRTKFF
jgi:hypothetical protein